MIKAISLISGGLDSTLATRMVLEQGITVIAANFISPFCRCDRRSKGCRHEAKFVSDELGIPLKMVNVTNDFLEVLKSPKHGYGSNINPCIDCRILMLKKARAMMEEEGASFLITGEVMGQRPMSQRKETMRLIEKEAGVQGLVLRPLSAKLLEPTVPEEKGWVDRNKLLDISGRSRKPQMKLAQDYNITDYPCPAGGCLLTDPHFSLRVRDLIDHDELNMEDINLLNYGRYFRLGHHTKLVVGKDEHDNAMIEARLSEHDVLFSPEEEVRGASALGRGDFSSPQMIALAAGIVSRYFNKNDVSAAARVVVNHRGRKETIEVRPFSDEETKKYLI
jgi:tRNA-specific 2-thiouridylase